MAGERALDDRRGRRPAPRRPRRARCPPGTPEAFTEPVDDPLADLVARFARTHGPFTTADVATRLGLGVAVAAPDPGPARGVQGRVLEGEFRPAGAGAEWCDAEVLRRLRRRSLARAAQGGRAGRAGDARPVPAGLAARGPTARPPGPARRRRRASPWSSSSPAAPCPPARWSRWCCRQPGRRLRALDARRAHRHRRGALGRPRHAAGHRRLGVAAPRRHRPPDAARPRSELDLSPLHYVDVDALAGGGAYFFRQLSDAVGSTDDRAMTAALWELAWAGRVGNDTLAPLRALTRRRPRPRTAPGRARRARAPRQHPAAADRRCRPAPGRRTTAGRWSLLPDLETDPTRRAHAVAEGMLERHGVVTRGAVDERAGAGRLRRRLQGAVRVRGVRPLPARLLRGRSGRRPVRRRRRRRPAARAHQGRRATGREARASVTLAATDPANPYGAALPWPDAGEGGPPARPQGRRPRGAGRRAAGGLRRARRPHPAHVRHRRRDRLRRLLTQAFDALAGAVRRGALGRLTVETADGEALLGSGDRSTALRRALEAAGFVATPRGLRLRA